MSAARPRPARSIARCHRWPATVGLHTLCALRPCAPFSLSSVGAQLVSKIENYPTGPMDKPKDAVVIKEAGEL